ncbi:major capsid protein [Acinetobacter puyangensis]
METTEIVAYTVTIIAAIGVVGAAVLMIPLAAKGFKWLRQAF